MIRPIASLFLMIVATTATADQSTPNERPRLSLSMRGELAAHDDSDGRYALGASTRYQFGENRSFTLSADGDVLFAADDDLIPRDRVAGELVVGKVVAQADESSLRGIAVRLRHASDAAIELDGTTLGGVGMASETEGAADGAVIGNKLRLMIEGGQAVNNGWRYLVLQARGEGLAYVCFRLKKDSKHGVCLEANANIAAGWLQTELDGGISLKYRRVLAKKRRSFLNEFLVGSRVGTNLAVDREDLHAGGLATFGIEIR